MSDNTKAFEDTTTDDSYMEEAESLMDRLIEQELTSIEALAFCMRHMIADGDTTTDDLKVMMDPIFPNLTDHAQMLLRIYYQGPAYDEYTQYQKDAEIGCVWPDKIPAVLLMQYGASITNVPTQSFTQSIGDDKATSQFFKSLNYAHSILRNALLQTYNYGEEELPTARIIDAVNFAKREDGDFINEVPFNVWFPETLLAIPHMLYNHLDTSIPN